MEKLLDLNGRTAIVFGGLGNLGTYITQKFYDYGANVVISYYKNEEEKARKRVDELDSTRERVLALFCDVADEKSVETLIQKTEEKFETIDIVVNLIHNPEFVPKNVADMDWSDWQNHLIAQKGQFLICKHVLPSMRKNKYGRIVFISGGLAVRYMNGCSAFSTIKSGLHAFCKTLAKEEGKNNITVNIVAPGRITALDTDGEVSWDEVSEEILKNTPLNHFATPEDVANTVLYFSSPIADSMTGQTLYVACGELML